MKGKRWGLTLYDKNLRTYSLHLDNSKVKFICLYKKNYRIQLRRHKHRTGSQALQDGCARSSISTHTPQTKIPAKAHLSTSETPIPREFSRHTQTHTPEFL